MATSCEPQCAEKQEKSGFKKTWKSLFNEGHEVSDSIFSCLDFETFLACRLVCKDWKPAVNTYRPKWKEMKAMPLLLVKAVRDRKELLAHALMAGGADVLLQDDEKINWKGPTKMTALHWAARNGLESIAEVLIEKGADTEATDKRRFTPLSWASMQGHVEVVKILINAGADVEGGPCYTSAPLTIACFQGHEEIVKILLQSGADILAEADEEQTVIHFASGAYVHWVDHWDPKNCKVSIIQMLISNGADPLARNTPGRTPIDFASEAGLTDIVEFLISQGADVNVTDDYNRTPLHQAANYGHSSVVELLISHGADVNAKNDEDADREERFLGMTPMHLAAWGHMQYQGHPDVVDILVSHGADVNALTEGKLTPLHIAASTGCAETARRLIAKGADVNAAAGIGKKNDTPLHRACLRGQHPVVDVLLKSGARLDLKDTNNVTPFQLTDPRDPYIRHLLVSHAHSLVPGYKRKSVTFKTGNAKRRRF